MAGWLGCAEIRAQVTGWFGGADPTGEPVWGRALDDLWLRDAAVCVARCVLSRGGERRADERHANDHLKVVLWVKHVVPSDRFAAMP